MSYIKILRNENMSIKGQLIDELLQEEFAEDYQGLDDDMPDACSEWIGDLKDDELCDIILRIYHKEIS